MEKFRWEMLRYEARWSDSQARLQLPTDFVSGAQMVQDFFLCPQS